MRHRQRNLGQLDMLMGVVGLRIDGSSAAGARAGQDMPGFGRRKQRLAIPLMALLGSGLTFGGGFGLGFAFLPG